jgi:hypothetical protein
MSGETLSRVSARTAAEVCDRIDFDDETRSLLRPEMTPRGFLDLLTKEERYPAAVQFLSRALPKPEAIWWGLLCVREAVGKDPSPRVRAALEGVERWVSNPSEENRRATMPLGEAAGLATPAGSLAMATFVSGGSLGPENVAPVPPPEELTSRLVGAAVMIAAFSKEPGETPGNYRNYLQKGIEVGDGRSRWDRAR